MNIPIKIKIPDLWKDFEFVKNDWGSINYLVGPNGSGKTRFAEALLPQLKTTGLSARYLSAERLAGQERHSESWGHILPLRKGLDVGQFPQYYAWGERQGLSADALIVLKQRLNVRIKVEAFLSSLFGRRIRFAEEGGYLRPKIQRILGGQEYSLKEAECHGLKELIGLLAFLYDDKFNCLVIDEPELHLHPQFQSFLVQEARRMSGDPRQDASKKCFLFITHSPFILDFRTVGELRDCILFQPQKPPAYLGDLDSQDEFLLKKFLPRLNTHHKQFFFSSRPIFVEGYTDQQLFTLIQESRNKLLGATGACFIDVGGKDEQDFFFRLCKRLNTDAQFISDLDVLTRGKLRDSVSEDERSKQFIQQAGIGTSLADAIQKLVQKLDVLAKAVKESTDPELNDLQSALTQAGNDTHKIRYRISAALINQTGIIKTALHNNAGEVEFCTAMVRNLCRACAATGVHLLPNGVLENHLSSYSGLPYAVPDETKAKLFEIERDWILAGQSLGDVETRYSSLLPVLDAASGQCEVDLKKHLGYSISELIGAIQLGFERGEIVDGESLKSHATVDWSTYARIVTLVSFVADDGKFDCKLKLKPLVDAQGQEITITDTTAHAKFAL